MGGFFRQQEVDVYEPNQVTPQLVEPVAAPVCLGAEGW